MSYREHAPPRALEPWLECLWERRRRAGAPVRVLPDGCIDIVFTEGAGAQVVGANTTAFVVAVRRRTRVVGARLLPGSAPALLGIAAEAMRDVRAPVARGAARAAPGSIEALAATRRSPRRAARRAARRARCGAPRPDPLVRAAVSRLERPDVAIAALADDLGVSERQLRRRVTTAVGYGPRRLARVLRLARALRRRARGRRAGARRVRRRLRRPGALHARLPRARRRPAVGAAPGRDGRFLQDGRRLLVDHARMTSDLTAIPNVGPAVALKLQRLGFDSLDDLRGRDADELFERFCALEGRAAGPVPARHLHRRRRLRRRRSRAPLVGVQPRAQGARTCLTSRSASAG